MLIKFLAIVSLITVITLIWKATAQRCFTDASDCVSSPRDSGLATYESCCEPLKSNSSIQRSFEAGNGDCHECIMIGLEQSVYTLNESIAVYMRRLKLIAPATNVLTVRPILRLIGIPGTASVNDFSIISTDIILDPIITGINIAITISVDGTAGESPETFTIASQPPVVSSSNDPLFLFRNTTVTIIDSDVNVPSNAVTTAILVIVSTFGLVIGIIAMALFPCFLLCKYFKNKRSKSNELNTTENFYELTNTQLSLPTLNVSPELFASLSKMLILKWQVRLLDIIGQGQFGIVYKGHLLRSKSGNDYTIVAVKTLKGNFDSDAVEQLVKESIQMKDFQHRNVMGMLGVCLDAGPAPYLVLPFMKNGDLHSYLKSNREDLILSHEADDDKIMIVRTKLLLMCLQIANGMKYLADNDIVHRDLAARNCMIDEFWIVKVADFGLTKSVYEKRYFREDKDESVKLPIKWMAIESIDDGIFTEKTDVWSFGVTCWEIFSGGRMPFGGLHPSTLAKALRSGERMDVPENLACSPEVFATVMQQCWESDPDKRPTFSQLTVAIDAIATAMTGYMELSVFSDQPDENGIND